MIQDRMKISLLLLIVLLIFSTISTNMFVNAKPMKRVYMDRTITMPNHAANTDAIWRSDGECRRINELLEKPNELKQHISSLKISEEKRLCVKCPDYPRALLKIATSMSRSEIRMSHLCRGIECSKAATDETLQALHYARAKEYKAMREYSKAIVDFKHVLSFERPIGVANVKYHPEFLLGVVLYNYGDTEESLMYFYKVVNSHEYSSSDPKAKADIWFWIGAAEALLAIDRPHFCMDRSVHSRNPSRHPSAPPAPSRSEHQLCSTEFQCLPQNYTDTCHAFEFKFNVGIDAVECAYCKTLELDPHHDLVHRYWMEYLIDIGMHAKALKLFDTSLKSKGSDVDTSISRLVGIAHHALGNYTAAIDYYDLSHSLLLKEWTSYQRAYIFGPTSSSTSTSTLAQVFEKATAQFPSELKNCWSHGKKESDFMQYFGRLHSEGVSHIHDQQNQNCFHLHQVESLLPSRLSLSRAFKVGEPLMEFYQLNAFGFKRNQRQLRAMSLGVIDLCQQIYHEVVTSNFRDHEKTYRWASDVLIKWRSVSAPHEPVFWSSESILVNPTRARTQITKSGSKVVRYYPYYSRCIEKVKSIISRSRFARTLESKQAILSAKSLNDIVEFIGKDDFYITTKVRTSNGSIIEGTALAWENRVDFGILTMHSSERWKKYDTEMTRLWKEVMIILRSEFKSSKSGDLYIHKVLSMMHIWYNFMPLSRGSAGIGAALFQSLMLLSRSSKHIQFVTQPLPRDVQLDWEALLVDDGATFASRVYQLMMMRHVQHDHDRQDTISMLDELLTLKIPTRTCDVIDGLNRIINNNIN